MLICIQHNFSFLSKLLMYEHYLKSGSCSTKIDYRLSLLLPLQLPLAIYSVGLKKFIEFDLNNIRKYGKPPYTVVVVHGGPGAGGEMAPVARELSNDFGVLEPIQTTSTIQGQVNELKSVVEKNCDFPVTLIGFSWGAWLCYTFAANNPGLLAKLILIGSGPFDEKYATEIQKTRFSRLSKKEISELQSFFYVLNNPTT